MRLVLTCALCLFSLISPCAHAQNGAAFPPAMLSAKTVVLLNDTHAQAVEDGAVEELKQWGHLRVVDDLDSADLVLHFSKESDHSTSNSQKKDEKSNDTSYSFNVTMSSTIHMSATSKDGFVPFYKTSTGDGKQKAGRECVQAFISAYQEARQKHPPQ